MNSMMMKNIEKEFVDEHRDTKTMTMMMMWIMLAIGDEMNEI